MTDDDLALTDDTEALGARVRTGLRWSFVSRFIGRVLNPVTGIILARILSPDDFGVFAVAMVALNGLVSVNELGVTYAVVRWPGDLARVARTATTIAIGASIVFFGLCFAGAPWFASELNTPSATGVLRLLAVGVIIDGIASVPIGFLTRDFRQDRRAIADWAGFLVSTGLTIGLALSGFGAWSLAWGRLAGNTVSTGLLYVFSPARPRPGWDSRIACELLRFGIPLTGSSFLVFAMLNVDYVVVGHELGTVALGFYVLAFNLSSFPVNLLSTSIRPVSIPAFACFQDDRRRLAGIFVKWLHVLAVAVVPLCALLSALSIPVVKIVYGDKWLPAAAPLVFLAILGGIRVLLDFCYDLFVAVGKSRTLIALQGLWVAALIPVLTVGARLDGIRGVGIGHVIVALGIVAPAFLYALRRQGVATAGALEAVARPVVGGVISGAMGVLAVHVVGTGLAGLAIGGLVVIVTYVLVGVSLRELRSLPDAIRGKGLEVEPAGDAAPTAG